MESNSFFVLIGVIAAVSFLLSFAQVIWSRSALASFMVIYTPTLFAAIVCICLSALGYLK